ncbi:MAG: D-2-hydroxyacid dehydrogenase [Acidobacteria bacterium]|nr:D-2-hydroxyacid dehydrogenase [Acidobacteriota bacterium]
MKRILLILLLIPAVFALTASAQGKNILVSGGVPEEIAEWQKVSSKVTLIAVTRETIMSQIADADAVIGSITPEQVRAGKKLKWVQTMSAGVEQVLHLSGGNDLRDSDIVLTNNQIVQGPEIADHAMAMLLSLTRRLPRYIAARDKETWREGPAFDGIELRGKTAVVIGVGGIGSQIAVRAWAHGMNVIGVDPDDIPLSPFITEVVKPDRLDEVVPRADVVFVAAPWTAMSYRMMGAKQFEMMKQDSYFIAVSRGGLYDLGALVKALDSKRLAGAGVDVTDPEPLPKGHSLWGFDNAIITPHVAGRSDRDRARMLGTIQENIRRFGEGMPLLNVVDKQKGY